MQGLFTSYISNKSGNEKLDPTEMIIPTRAWKHLSDDELLNQQKKLTLHPQDIASYRARILSYNILADAYTQGICNVANYPGISLNVFQDFEFRAQRIIREIKGESVEGDVHLADIVCLQEVDHYEKYYQPEFKKMGCETEVIWRKNTDAELIAW